MSSAWISTDGAPSFNDGGEVGLDQFRHVGFGHRLQHQLPLALGAGFEAVEPRFQIGQSQSDAGRHGFIV